MRAANVNRIDAVPGGGPESGADVVTAIEHFVRDLDRSLSGPARLKSDLIAEARDGLVDAAAAYRAGGLPPAEAEGRAVREFGRLPDLAPAYQAELAAAAAQRLTLWLALVPMALGAGTDLMWRWAPWTTVRPPAGYAVLASGVDRLGTLLAVGGLLAYAWLAWSAHRGRVVSAATARRMAFGGLCAVAALGAGGLSIYALTITHARAALTWPPMIIGLIVTTTALGWLARAAKRCLAWTAAPAR
jgi:hypothetical protein